MPNAIKSVVALAALALALTLTLQSTSAEAATCVRIEKDAVVPERIRQGECFELQGGNTIKDPVAVTGHLIIKAGRRVTVKERSGIALSGSGKLTVRGTLLLERNAELHLKDGANLYNTGEVILEERAGILGGDHISIVNAGLLHGKDSNGMALTGTGGMRNSGILHLKKSDLSLGGAFVLENYGTLLSEGDSHIRLFDGSKLKNEGTLKTDSHSVYELRDRAHMTNRKTQAFFGTLSAKERSLFENRAAFRMQRPSNLELRNHAQFKNAHTFETSGSASLKDQSRMLNEGVFALRGSSSFKIGDQALLINTGTYRSDGGTLYLQSDANFDNQNILSGQESRKTDALQHRHTLPESTQRKILEKERQRLLENRSTAPLVRDGASHGAVEAPGSADVRSEERADAAGGADPSGIRGF